MLDLSYSLVIEATDEPDFFGFWSPELEGFTGIGHSVEDCLYQAKWGMKEHVELLEQQHLPVPPLNLVLWSPFVINTLPTSPDSVMFRRDTRIRARVPYGLYMSGRRSRC